MSLRRAIPRPRLGARGVAALLGLTVALMTLGVSLVVGRLVNDRAEVRFEATADVVARSLQEGITDIGRQLHSFAAFFGASESVTDDEFSIFAARSPFAAGVDEWMLIGVIENQDLPAFKAEVRSDHDGFQVRELGSPEHPGGHYIVWHAASLSSRLDPHGYDLAGIPELRQAVDRAIASRRLVSSAELPLPVVGDRGFYMILALGNRHDPWPSLVAAPVHLDRLLEASLPSSLAEQVEVAISQAGGLSPIADSTTAVDWVSAGGRIWRVAVTPLEDSDLLPPFETLAIALGAAGLVGGLMAFAVFGFVRRREVQQALAETRRLNEARDQFLAAISHEIRTPLTAVVGFAGVVRESGPDLPDEELWEMIRIIDEQSRAVSAIVADLLVIGRTDTQSLHLSAEPVAVAEAVTPALESLPGWQRDKVTVSVDDRRVIADRNRMSQILRNLIVNACLHGGDRIDVETDVDEDFVHVRVVDDGEGIPAEFEQAVFDPYFSVTASAKPLPSVGLGLFVARRLAEAMGGSLGYRREGDFTVFDLALPKAEQPEAILVG